MKKRTLLILALSSLSLSTFAGGMQATGWAWINDDGDASTATFISAEDVTPVTVTTDGVIRLRVRFDNMNDGGKTTTSLKYVAGPAPIVDVAGDNAMLTEVGPGAFFDWASSAYVSDATPIETRDITFNSVNGGDYQATYAPGIFVSSAQPFSVPTKSYSELEYCIKPTSNLVNGTYCFVPGGSEISILPTSNNLESFPEITYELHSKLDLTKISAIVAAIKDGSLNLSNLTNGTVKVAIVNALGATVKSITAQVVDGKLAIVTEGLAQGLYLVQINGVTCKKVIIK